MSNQNIPITLVPTPVPTGTEGMTVNDLLNIISQYMSASISASVSFFVQGSNWPTSNQGIFYNQTLNKFGNWNSSLGKYIPVSDVAVGDIRASYVGSDDLANGWVVLNGRQLTTIAGLTQQQLSNLQIIYGSAPSAVLPNMPFLAGLNNPPVNGSFSNISQSAVSPVAGYIGALPFDATYNQSQHTALGAAAEQLDVSVQNLNTTVQKAIGVSESLLEAINGSGSSSGGPVNRVFAGFP